MAPSWVREWKYLDVLKYNFVDLKDRARVRGWSSSESTEASPRGEHEIVKQSLPGRESLVSMAESTLKVQ